MNRRFVGFVIAGCCLMSAKAQVAANGATIAPGTTVEPSVTFNKLLSETENPMLSLVEAMPAEKFSFAPSAAIFVPSQKTDYTGTRTFGALAIHVAQANYAIGQRIGDVKPDIDPKSLADLKDKDRIVAALAASFAFLHQEMNALTSTSAMQSVRGPATHLALAVAVIVHAEDEYGQMVEYARMNGVVPPASEKKPM